MSIPLCSSWMLKVREREEGAVPFSWCFRECITAVRTLMFKERDREARVWGSGTQEEVTGGADHAGNLQGHCICILRVARGHWVLSSRKGKHQSLLQPRSM